MVGDKYEHEHKFKGDKILRLIGTNNRVLWLKTCKCGQEVGHDYGDYEEVIHRYKDAKTAQLDKAV